MLEEPGPAGIGQNAAVAPHATLAQPAGTRLEGRTGRFFGGERLRISLMALPFVLFVVLFSYVPLLGWVFAFFDYTPGIPLAKSPFVGLANFEMALDFRAGSELGKVIRNTLALSLLSIAASGLAPLFAVLLNEMRSKFLRRVIQTTTTLPYFISWILVYAIAWATFSINDGFVNLMLIRAGILREAINPLANGPFAWYFQTLLGIWKNLGFASIIYLAAITGIDPELYDAASVDGAGRFRRILHITVPGILPTYVVLLLLSISSLLSNGFDQYYAFMNALVQDRLSVLDYYVYRVGLALNRYSFSTALGVFKTLISVTLLFSVNWLARRVRGYSIV